MLFLRSFVTCHERATGVGETKTITNSVKMLFFRSFVTKGYCVTISHGAEC